MMKVIPASQVRAGDILFAWVFSDQHNAWQWVTRVETIATGIIRLDLGYGGYRQEVESGDLLIVDSSRRAEANKASTEQSGSDLRER